MSKLSSNVRSCIEQQVQSTSITGPSEGAKKLQDRLHLLLNKLAQSMKIINEWPDEDSGGGGEHTETTSKLTNSVLEVVDALKEVEGTIKTDAVLRKSLQDCQVPVNLLDLLDHGNGLNPGTLFRVVGCKILTVLDDRFGCRLSYWLAFCLMNGFVTTSDLTMCCFLILS